MSKRRRYSRQQQARNQQQPRTQGALALADNGSTPATPANVVRTFTPAPMAGNAQYNAQGNQQWGPTSNTAGEAPANQYYPNMPEVKDDRPLLSNIGASGTAIFSGVVTSEEYNPDFYWKDGIRVYEQMLRNDGQVNAVREIVEQPILRAEKHIVPGSSSARDKEIASFVETCLFEDMRYTSTDGIEEIQTWDELLRHILMHLWYGFMCFEQVWRIEDGWVKWARWTPLLPRTIWRWWVGDDNALTGIQQWTFKNHNYEFVDIPARKLVRFHRRLEGQNYEGVSVLRSAYKHWFYKVQFEKIEAIGAERNAVVPAVIKLPEGFTSSDSIQAQTIVANIRANSQMGVVLPPNWEIEYMRNFQRQAVQMQDSIQYHDVMIARNSLAQFINLGSTETGAYSLDDSQRKDFLNNLQSICCAIEDTINNGPIRQLVDYNYDGVEVYPKLQFGKVLMSDLSSLADALSKLATAGMLHGDPELEDFIREAGGLPGAPQSVIAAYNPTAPTTPSRPGNDNASSHDTQNPTQSKVQGTSNANSTGPDDAGSSGDTGGGDGGGGGSFSEVRLLAEALRATVQAIDPVERGLSFRLYAPDQARDSHGRFEDEGAPSKQSGGSGRGRGSRGGGASAKSSQTSKSAKGEHAATAKSSGGSRSGGSGKGSKAKAQHEDMHARSARLQKEHGLKAEVKPGHELKPFATHPVPPPESNPTKGPNAHYLKEVYGEHQLGLALSRYSHTLLKQTADEAGVKPGRSKGETVSRIVSHVTEGRYSANFAKGENAANTPKEPSATKTTRAPRATKAAKSEEEQHAAKVAKAQQQVAEHEAKVNAAAKEWQREGKTAQQSSTALENHNAARRELARSQKALAKLEGRQLHPDEALSTRQEWAKKVAEGDVRAVRSTNRSAKSATVSRTEHEKVQAELARVKAENEALKTGQKTTAGKGEKTTTAKSDKAARESLKAEWHVAGRQIDPYAMLDPHLLYAVYGSHQLRTALTQYSHESLREAARALGMKSTGRSREETMSKLYEHVTKTPVETVREHYTKHPRQSFSGVERMNNT